MHHEETFRSDVLPRCGTSEFSHRLRIEVRPIWQYLERVAPVEKFVLGKVHHHLPFACLPTNRNDLQPIAAAAQLCRHRNEMEDRPPGVFGEVVRLRVP